MPHFSTTSRKRLSTCEPILQDICKEVLLRLPWTDEETGIKIMDCIIIEGHRTKERQNYLVEQGMSQLNWPESNHNAKPSRAVDMAPYHVDKPHIHWTDKKEMWAFSKLVLKVAKEKGVTLRWGGDWNMNGMPVFDDPEEGFFDGPHYELL